MSIKKTFWSDAAKGGLVIGLSLFIISLLELVIGVKLKSITSLLFFLVLILLVYYFAKKRATKATGDLTFSYGQSVGYIVAMMLFAGFIVGLGSYLLQNYIAPEYYQKLVDDTIAQNSMLADDSELAQKVVSLSKTLSKNIFFMILSGLLSTVFYGTIVALVVSAFVKKKEDVFSDQERE